nr:polyprenyl synthetase family protein [Desulfobulbaceae bacterium]
MNKDTLVSLLKPETQKIDTIMHDDLADIDNTLLHEVISYAIFNGGKRIRPLLAVLAARLCRPDNLEDPTDLYRFSLSFEYLHAASLLHDDVIDRAQKRRGQKSANTVWDNTHVILAGDFLHSRAMYLAGTRGNAKCLAIISKATEAMVNSEFIQLENANTLNTSEENYYRVLHGKTAALISAACETGSIFSGGTETQSKALQLFGTNLGLTFQIVDDLLDYLGDSTKTGKALGNDFQEKKMTLPLIYTLTHADSRHKQQLLTLLESNSDSPVTAFEQARNIIEETGGFAYAQQTARDLIEEALHSLDIFAEDQTK